MPVQEPATKEVFPSAFYDEVYFARMSPSNRQLFRESCGRQIHPHRMYYVDLAQIEPGMKLLDIGCGAGEVLMWCALNKGVEGWGIDYAKTALEIAQELGKLLPVNIKERVHFSLGDCTILNQFPDEHFDRVISMSVIEHLYDWQIESMLKEAFRVLREDGIFILETHPNRNAEKFAWPLARSIMGLLQGRATRIPVAQEDEGGHVNVQSPGSLRCHLRRAGFASKIILRPGTEFVQQTWFVKLVGSFLVSMFPFNYWFANEIAVIACKGRRELRRLSFPAFSMGLKRSEIPR